MQFRLLDILADPDNPRNWPLEIEVFKSEKRERSKKPIPHSETGLLCKFYCSRKKKFLVEDPLEPEEKTLPKSEINQVVSFEECLRCFEEEIVDAILYFEHKGKVRYFIVDREIPVMYPDSLRDAKQEKAFFYRYSDEIAKLGIMMPDEQ
ncbi:MAG: hypothetical protein D6732_14720 [Methanobacteriota archaeon]|nr:MAG: hypothetical protein D6732_14720 [Euryarchaeota archaeon]